MRIEFDRRCVERGSHKTHIEQNRQSMDGKTRATGGKGTKGTQSNSPTHSTISACLLVTQLSMALTWLFFLLPSFFLILYLFLPLNISNIKKIAMLYPHGSPMHGCLSDHCPVTISPERYPIRLLFPRLLLPNAHCSHTHTDTHMVAQFFLFLPSFLPDGLGRGTGHLYVARFLHLFHSRFFAPRTIAGRN